MFITAQESSLSEKYLSVFSVHGKYQNTFPSFAQTLVSSILYLATVRQNHGGV